MRAKVTLFLALLLCICSITTATLVLADVECWSGHIIKDGFTPPKNTTIIHYLNDHGDGFTKVANRIDSLYVGEHHRFTVALNVRKTATIRWYSSNKEVATIGEKTGNLTAKAAGTTTITMKDLKNRERETFVVEVFPTVELPEIPAEWYDVKVGKAWVISGTGYKETDAVTLVLKECYAPLYEQCTMLKIPDVVDGKPVVNIATANYPDFGKFDKIFPSLKMLQAPYYIARWTKSKATSLDVVCCGELPDYIVGVNRWLYIPESVEGVEGRGFGTKLTKIVRIPASVKALFVEDVEMSWTYHSMPGAVYSVDGNNTNYYSIFGVLYSYDCPLYRDTVQLDYKYAEYRNSYITYEICNQCRILAF